MSAGEYKVSSTIQLEGRALEIARQIRGCHNAMVAAREDLMVQMNAAAQEQNANLEMLWKQLHDLTGTDPTDGGHYHLDTDYMEEHGLAFIKIITAEDNISQSLSSVFSGAMN